MQREIDRKENENSSMAAVDVDDPEKDIYDTLKVKS